MKDVESAKRPNMIPGLTSAYSEVSQELSRYYPASLAAIQVNSYK